MPVPEIPDIPDLAQAIGVPTRLLIDYYQNADNFYRVFRIRKRGGRGYRLICAPSADVKGLQRWIMVFILRPIRLHDAATAFRPGCSVLRNAERHVGADFVLNIDLADFFPSISRPRVTGLFKSLGYSPRVAYALAAITTYKGRLPQGAPSSPEIANAICRRLDARMSGLCRTRNWTYSRYCDDITISGAGDPSRLMPVLAQIADEEGFRLNPRKTRIARKGMRQEVTGLVVNEKTNLPRHSRRRWRAVFYQASLHPEEFKHRLPELEGYIGFLQMVRPDEPALEVYKNVLADVRAAAV